MDQRSRDGNLSTHLKRSRSFWGRIYPNIETLSARTSSSLEQIIQSSNFKKTVHLGGAEGSKRRPIPPWRADRVYELRILPEDGHSRDHPRFLGSDGCNFTWSRRSGLWYEMGWSLVVNPWITVGHNSGKLIKNVHTWVGSAQNRVGIVRARHWTEQFTAIPPEIKNHGKHHLWPKDEDSHFLGQKWENCDRNTREEQK